MSIRAVHHLNCATLCPLAGALLGQGGGLGRGRLVCHCLLVETARDGLVLIDSGFGTRDIEGHTGIATPLRLLLGPRFELAETAHAQVRALGFAPEDVRHIVVTHLDLDHAGGLPDFPWAKVHLHAREHAAAMTRATLPERQRYLTAHWQHGPDWQVYAEDGDTWRGLPAIARLRGLDADIGLLPMHGHSRGHSAVLVRAGDRWLVHAGDAYFHRATVEGTRRVPLGLAAFESMAQLDPVRRRASAAALRQLRESYADLDLFCAHAPDEWETMRARNAPWRADARATA
jgi:glyoxylase-like metal-dependent hydrolase (beta-lactamase superfamily II)